MSTGDVKDVSDNRKERERIWKKINSRQFGKIVDRLPWVYFLPYSFSFLSVIRNILHISCAHLCKPTSLFMISFFPHLMKSNWSFSSHYASFRRSSLNFPDGMKCSLSSKFIVPFPNIIQLFVQCQHGGVKWGSTAQSLELKCIDSNTIIQILWFNML